VLLQGHRFSTASGVLRLDLIATSQAVAWLTYFSLLESSMAARAGALNEAFPSQNHNSAWLSSSSLIPRNL
jgi:hypothetical protein